MGTGTSSPAAAEEVLSKLQRQHVHRAEVERIGAQLKELARTDPLDYMDAVSTQYCGGVGSHRRRPQERDSVLRRYSEYFGIGKRPSCPVINRYTRVLKRMQRTLNVPALTWPEVVNIILDDTDRELVRVALRDQSEAQLDAAVDQTVQHYFTRVARRHGDVVSGSVVSKRVAADGKTRLCQVLLPSGELCPQVSHMSIDLSRIFFTDCCSMCSAHMKQLARQAAELLAQSALDSFIWSTAVPNNGVWDLRYWIRNREDVLFYANMLKKIVVAAKGLLLSATPPPPPPTRRR